MNFILKVLRIHFQFLVGIITTMIITTIQAESMLGKMLEKLKMSRLKKYY